MTLPACSPGYDVVSWTDLNVLAVPGLRILTFNNDRFVSADKGKWQTP